LSRFDLILDVNDTTDSGSEWRSAWLDSSDVHVVAVVTSNRDGNTQVEYSTDGSSNDLGRDFVPTTTAQLSVPSSYFRLFVASDNPNTAFKATVRRMY